MGRLQTLDWTTINIARLRLLPKYTLPPTYHLQRDCGNGCAGDPPGFPTYFTRNVYTANGNNPGRGPQTVITFEGVNYVVSHSDDWRTEGGNIAREAERLNKLYLPLPEDQERVQMWIQATYAHHAHCYADPEGVITGKKEPHGIVIYPLPDYALRSFHDDPRFSDEWRAKEKAEVKAANAELRRKAAEFCTVEKQNAVRIIRRYYPEHKPRTEWITGAAPQNPGNWWETAAKRPTPEQCAGQYDRVHPVNVSWCQFCGWRAEEATR